MLKRNFALGLSLLIGAPAVAQEAQKHQESGFEELKANLEKKAQAVAEHWSKLPDGSKEGIIVGAEGAVTLYGAVKHFSEKARAAGRAEGSLQGAIAGAEQMAQELRAQSPTGRAATALREAIEQTYGGNAESTVIRHVVKRPLVQVEFVPVGSLTKEVVTSAQERGGFLRASRTVTTHTTMPLLFQFEQRAIDQLDGSHTITLKIVHPEQWAERAVFGFESKGPLGLVDEVIAELEHKIQAAQNTQLFKEALPTMPTRETFYSTLRTKSGDHMIHSSGVRDEILAYSRFRTLRAVNPTGFTLSLRDGMGLEDVRLPAPAAAPRSSLLSKVGTGAKRLVWFYSAGDLCIRLGDLVKTGETSAGLTAWDDAYYYCKDLSSEYLNK